MHSLQKTYIDKIKDQFRTRYDSLKQIYEDRLGSLANQIQASVYEVSESNCFAE